MTCNILINTTANRKGKNLESRVVSDVSTWKSVRRANTEQEAPRSIMGRRATDVNHWPPLLPRSYRRKLAHWAKCLKLGVSQVASECTSGLNGLNWVYLLLDQNKVGG